MTQINPAPQNAPLLPKSLKHSTIRIPSVGNGKSFFLFQPSTNRLPHIGTKIPFLLSVSESELSQPAYWLSALFLISHLLAGTFNRKSTPKFTSPPMTIDIPSTDHENDLQPGWLQDSPFFLPIQTYQQAINFSLVPLFWGGGWWCCFL